MYMYDTPGLSDMLQQQDQFELDLNMIFLFSGLDGFCCFFK